MFIKSLTTTAAAISLVGRALPNGHPFVPPGPGDSRAPCPAMNSGQSRVHVPHNGKDINADQLADAINSVYHIERPFAVSLIQQAIACCSRSGNNFTVSSLTDMSVANMIEHPASLVHNDPLPGETHGSPIVNRTLLEELIGGRNIVTLEDFARHKVRRQAGLSRPLSPAVANASLAESSMTLLVLGDGEKVKACDLRAWYGDERLPDGLEFARKDVTFAGIVVNREVIRAKMDELD